MAGDTISPTTNRATLEELSGNIDRIEVIASIKKGSAQNAPREKNAADTINRSKDGLDFLPPESQFFLDRMPVVKHMAIQAREAGDFELGHIFFVHHLTKETLGVLAAYAALGCERLTALFTNYELTFPKELEESTVALFASRPNWRCAMVFRDSDGKYTVAPQLTLPSGWFPAERVAEYGETHYEAANFHLGVYLLCDMLRSVKGETLTIVENGGYVAPKVQEWCLDEVSLSKMFSTTCWKADDFGWDASMTAKELMAPVIRGTVEHTLNGVVKLTDVLKAHDGKLAFPSYSLAKSKLKEAEEPHDVAAGVLYAFEGHLKADGRTLSKRSPMIVGANGNIGGHATRLCVARCIFGNPVVRVDPFLKVIDDQLDFMSLDMVPDDVLGRVDTILGATACDVLKPSVLERLIMSEVGWTNGTRNVWLLSASTKTKEFDTVLTMLEKVAKAKAAGKLDEVKEVLRASGLTRLASAVVDAQTEFIESFGYRLGTVYTFELRELGKCQLFMMADGRPLNFAHGGVPLEIMDKVFSQLLALTITMQRVCTAQTPRRLEDLDHDVDSLLSAADLDALVKLLDEKEGGEIDRADWTSTLRSLKQLDDQKLSEVEDLFSHIDVDGSGTISRDEIKYYYSRNSVEDAPAGRHTLEERSALQEEFHKLADDDGAKTNLPPLSKTHSKARDRYLFLLDKQMTLKGSLIPAMESEAPKLLSTPKQPAGQPPAKFEIKLPMASKPEEAESGEGQMRRAESMPPTTSSMSPKQDGSPSEDKNVFLSMLKQVQKPFAKKEQKN